MAGPFLCRNKHPVGNPKLQRRLFSIFPILLIAVNVSGISGKTPFLVYVDIAADIAVFTLLIGMVFVKVFEKGPVTFHRIVGAVAGYMLIGNLWADLFQFLYIHLPGSVQLASSDSASVIRPATFLYFSYTTLTTTGFGDILPVQYHRTDAGNYRTADRCILPGRPHRQTGIPDGGKQSFPICRTGTKKSGQGMIVRI